MASIIGYTKAKIDTMLALLAPLISPAFTGTPTAPTAAPGDNSTKLATTAFVAASQAAQLISPTFTGDPKAPTPAPGDNDTSIATTAYVTAGFAPLGSPVLTGDPKAPTPSFGDNDTSIATSAFVQAALSPIYAFRVESYGAVGDGVTDDTVAIQAAINAAFAYAATSGTHYCEVVFGSNVYLVNGALQSGVSKGYAYGILYLPSVAPTAHKITVKFKGTSGADSMPHFSQTTQQVGSTTIKTTQTGFVYSGSLGSPSIISGPTSEQNGYTTNTPTFNNVHVILDGIALSAPANPSMNGFNFSLVIGLSVIIAGCETQQLPGSPTTPTNVVNALMMPWAMNGGMSDILKFSVEGWYRGVLVGENATIFSVKVLHCYSGIGVISSMSHGSMIQHLFIEDMHFGVEVVTTPDASGVWAGKPQLDIHLLELKTISVGGGYFSDAGNLLRGTVNFNYQSLNSDPRGTVPTGIKLISSLSPIGNVTAPAVPATTVSYTNTFYHDALVVISGGTVTVISVDGVTTGLTSGSVIVPSFKTITITYSVAPTWKWYLF